MTTSTNGSAPWAAPGNRRKRAGRDRDGGPPIFGAPVELRVTLLAAALGKALGFGPRSGPGCRGGQGFTWQPRPAWWRTAAMIASIFRHRDWRKLDMDLAFYLHVFAGISSDGQTCRASRTAWTAPSRVPPQVRDAGRNLPAGSPVDGRAAGLHSMAHAFRRIDAIAHLDSCQLQWIREVNLAQPEGKFAILGYLGFGASGNVISKQAELASACASSYRC